MALFAVTTLVVFHFALQRDSVEGDLAAGVLWVTLLFAAMLGINRLFVADREEGGFDGFLLAPVDRTALLVAKALRAARATSSSSSSSPSRRSRSCCSGRRSAPALRRASRSSCCWPTSGIAVVGTLVGALAVQTRARDLHRPAARAAAAAPGRHRRRRGPTAPLLRRSAAPSRSQGAGWPILGLYDLVFGLLAYARLRLPAGGLTPRRPCTARACAPSRILTAIDARRPAFALVFFYAPIDADQGFIQKIFYLHVPMAIVALCGFVGRRHLADPAPAHRRPHAGDLRSYVAIHLSLILGVGVLVTGSIWAKASWGHWWVWDEPTLVSFLIVFLLYATYQPLRFSIEDPERAGALRVASSRSSPGAFVPLNFLAVRLAAAARRTRACSATGGGDLPGAMRCRSSSALARRWTLLFVTLWKYEMASKNARAQLRALRRTLGGDDGRAPRAGRSPPRRSVSTHADALPDDAGYVAAAYLVFLALLLIYVAIMAMRAQPRIERDLGELNELADRRDRAPTPRSEPGSRPREPA